MIYFVILISIYFSFVLFSRHYNNPYKLRFIFGKKGAGKSTLMIKWMLHDIRHGWNVYTDMPDVNISGVHYFSTNELIKNCPPPHSSIYLDEVGLSMDNRNFKSFPPGLRDYFALQRKYKNKVTVNSQSYDVDKKVRDRVDQMFLVSNIGNIFSIVRPITRSITLTDASSQAESRIADQLKFSSIFSWKVIFLPKYHKWFSSFNAPPRDNVSFELIEGLNPKRELKLISQKKKV